MLFSEEKCLGHDFEDFKTNVLKSEHFEMTDPWVGHFGRFVWIRDSSNLEEKHVFNPFWGVSRDFREILKISRKSKKIDF